MNTDITFCTNDECPFAKRCKRIIDIDKLPYDRVLSWFVGAWNEDNDSCEFFIPKRCK